MGVGVGGVGGQPEGAAGDAGPEVWRDRLGRMPVTVRAPSLRRGHFFYL